MFVKPQSQLNVDSVPQRTSSFLLSANDITNARASLRRSRSAVAGDKPIEKEPVRTSARMDWKKEMQKTKMPGGVVVPNEKTASPEEDDHMNNTIPTITIDSARNSIRSSRSVNRDSIRSNRNIRNPDVRGTDEMLVKSPETVTVVHVHVTDADLYAESSGSSSTTSEHYDDNDIDDVLDNDVGVVDDNGHEAVTGDSKRNQLGLEDQKRKPYRSHSAMVTPVSAERRDSRAQRLQEKARKLVQKVSRNNSRSSSKGSKGTSEVRRKWSDKFKDFVGISTPSTNPFLPPEGQYINPFLDHANPDDTEIVTITVKGGGQKSTNPFREGNEDVTYTIRRPVGQRFDPATMMPPYMNPYQPNPIAVPPGGAVGPPIGYPYPYGYSVPAQAQVPMDYYQAGYPPISANNPFFQDFNPKEISGSPVDNEMSHDQEYTNPRDFIKYPSTNPYMTWSGMRGKNSVGRSRAQKVQQMWRSAASAINIVDFLKSKSAKMSVLDTGRRMTAEEVESSIRQSQQETKNITPETCSTEYV